MTTIRKTIESLENRMETLEKIIEKQEQMMSMMYTMISSQKLNIEMMASMLKEKTEVNITDDKKDHTHDMNVKISAHIIPKEISTPFPLVRRTMV